MRTGLPFWLSAGLASQNSLSGKGEDLPGGSNVEEAEVRRFPFPGSDPAGDVQADAGILQVRMPIGHAGGNPAVLYEHGVVCGPWKALYVEAQPAPHPGRVERGGLPSVL